MTQLFTTACVNLLLLACVFAPLEWLLPARVQRLWRRESGLDLAFFLGQYLLFGAAAVWCLSGLAHVLRELTPGALLAQSPAWLQVLSAFVLGDLVVYWVHRAFHRFEWLWRFHRVHHSSTELDWLAAHREHPVDGLVTQVAQNLPALLLGVRIELLAALIVFRNAWAIFIHSNVSVPLGPLRFVLGAPELHHFHHARVPRTRHNFANLAPWLDVVFGTYHRPVPGDGFELGVPGDDAKGYLQHLLEPLSVSTARSAVAPVGSGGGRG